MAYSLDRRVQSGINDQALPKQRKPVLDAVENAGNPGSHDTLPSTWLSWTRAHQSELLEDFPTLFTDDLDQSSGQELVTRLEQLITERKRLTSEVRKLRKRFKDLAHRPEESLTNKEREGAYITPVSELFRSPGLRQRRGAGMMGREWGMTAWFSGPLIQNWG